MGFQRLKHRYAKHLPRGGDSLQRLAEALRVLNQSGGAGDPFFLSRCLDLLAAHLGAAQTALVMLNGDVPETRWWHPEQEDEEPPAAVPSFCQWLLENPDRILVVKDMDEGPHVPFLVDRGAIPHRAALGCALRQGEGVKALLFAFFAQPRAFPRAEFALLDAVAGFMGRVVEIEDLKLSLHRLEESLAITRAVMEDSSIRDTETDLPNLRYLEVWQRALMGSEQRPESLVVAEFHLGLRGRKDAARLLKAAEGVRAGDLVVRAGPGRFLVIFQRTPRSVAHILLLRLRLQLGGVPMGATLWLPGREGQGLGACQPRLDAALAESAAQNPPALVWHLPEGAPAEAPPARKPESRAPSEPQPWQPMQIQTLRPGSRPGPVTPKVPVDED
ncbi:MAG: hypothetical protein U0P46_08885 [Holophagaceae bacterium]